MARQIRYFFNRIIAELVFGIFHARRCFVVISLFLPLVIPQCLYAGYRGGRTLIPRITDLRGDASVRQIKKCRRL